MANLQKFLIAVAPNGARRSKHDHSALPLTPLELAREAASCLKQGAAMIHLHVRDQHDQHSLAAEHYRPALKEVYNAVGEDMLIQVTSEAAGRYQAREQMDAMLELDPRCVSLGLREIIPNLGAVEEGGIFIRKLKQQQTLIQYILYSKDDILWYHTLCNMGVIPDKKNFILLVLGRYSERPTEAGDLKDYLTALTGGAHWMACAFGAKESQVMQNAAKLGGHSRVGFENNLQMADGSIADNNAALVTQTALAAKSCQRLLCNANDARELFG